LLGEGTHKDRSSNLKTLSGGNHFPQRRVKPGKGVGRRQIWVTEKVEKRKEESDIQIAQSTGHKPQTS